MKSAKGSVLGIIALVVIAAFLISIFLLTTKERPEASVKTNFKSFSSSQEFKDYLSRSAASGGFSFGLVAMMESPTAPFPYGSAAKARAEDLRYSRTNVQVAGVDEADILKIDGKNAYYIVVPPYYRIYYDEGPLGKILPPKYSYGDIKVISAYPPQEAKILSNISLNFYSDKIYNDDNLIIAIGSNEIEAFDITEKENPKSSWKIMLNGSYYIDSRKIGKNLYVLENNVAVLEECPVVVAYKVVASKISEARVGCNEIYYPFIGYPFPARALYTLMKINVEKGEIERSVSFFAGYGLEIYMSNENLYGAHQVRKSEFEILKDFIREKGKEVLPQELLDRINKVLSYDISDEAKMVELQNLIYGKSRKKSEEEAFFEKFAKAITEYMDEHSRDIVKTIVMKISLDSFEVKGSEWIPGVVLNQFSMDENNGYFRIATTTGFDNNSTENDVYVLNQELKVVGKLTGIERGERIFAVRFIGDKGYVVTFRQIDPLFVIDLSNPEKPELKGKLEIPGFSTYLHPIGDERIIGIGREDWKVKLSLFDVSDPENPKELGKYVLEESWSEALYNHRAILYDPENKLFVFPAENKIYGFKINNNVELAEKFNIGFSPKRAAYIGDFLYLFSDSKMAIYDLKNHEYVKEILFFKERPAPPPPPIE
jgi:uncharacterized secreted protein with C-terminal beta-propeller domain